MSFPKVLLNDCCDIVSGATPKTNVDSYWNGDIPWVTPKDLSALTGKDIWDTPTKITDDGFKRCSTSMLPTNSVLFSSRAPIGHVAVTRIPMCTNQGFKSFVPDPERVNADYLYYWLRGNKAYLQSLGNGATFKEVSKSVVANVAIPLPPLPEQKRIATILDQADALREKRRAAIAKLDELLQSVFLDMFGDPVTNPKGWDKVPLSEIGSVVTGNTPSRKSPEYYGDEMEWIKSDNLNTYEHILTPATEWLSKEGIKVSRLAPAGSILVTCIAGSPSCIGNLGYTDRLVAFNQQINALIPFDMSHSIFCYALLRFSKKLIQRASTNSMKGMVSKSSFSAIRVIWPPPEMRKQFPERFVEIESLRNKMNLQDNEANKLFSSLQQRAFRGDL